MKSDLRVPSLEDVETVYNNLGVDEDGFLNYDEYLIILFKVSLENFGEWNNSFDFSFNQ